MLLADEMGVGKTVQAIALASCYQVTGLSSRQPLIPLCLTSCFSSAG